MSIRIRGLCIMDMVLLFPERFKHFLIPFGNYEYLYRQINDKGVRETIGFLRTAF